ncbi:MAG: GNAT family N-acetyltransferase [bacterium]
MNDKHSFIIRPAGFADVETIFGLIKEHPQELIARPVCDIVQNIDRFLVCEGDGKILGTVSWGILPEIGAVQQPMVEIKSLAVRAGYLRSGIGRRLVGDAIAHVKRLAPAQIIVLTFTPEFFRKLGFREVPKASLMHKLYMGCINCAKYDSPFTCPEVAMALAN